MARKKRSYGRWIIIAAAVLIVLLAVVEYKPLIGQNAPKQLPSVEIRDYNGTRLDSINDFHENSIKGPQYIDKGTYRLKISGLVADPQEYTYDQILGHQSYKKVVTLNCVEGWSVTILWEGVLLNDIIAEAKPLPSAKVAIFHAYDGYTVTYPLDYLTQNSLLLAYKMNDVVLPPERGFPFQLVAESKWGYKWIKWITEIEFTDDTNYKGYWESRGYSKSGDLNESFYG